MKTKPNRLTRGAILLGLFIPLLLPGGARWPKEKLAVSNWIDSHRTPLITLSDAIWEAAETALSEHRSAAAIIALLEGEGFSVQKGVGEMETAFIATFGQGSPVIGILAEYDALPGISQKVQTEKEPLRPGAPGHGCGHNLFGAASTGAALAVKEIMIRFRIPGTIVLFGCPAEETVVGKTYMAREGTFSGLDAAIAWHPGTRNAISTNSSQALNSFRVRFAGQTAHAAGDPWNGRSALDAVELLDIGVNFLREHMPPTARIHYVIPAGGMAPNVVPDSAEVWYYVREKDRSSVENLYERVIAIIRGAEMMTGTTASVEIITGVHNTLPNIAGSRRMDENLRRVGPPLFSSSDQEFARNLQKSFAKEENGMSDRIEPFREKAEFSGGSTDVAEVSRITPTVQVSTACWPLEIPGHSWGIVAASGHAIGHLGMIAAAKVMAMTAIDFLRDEALLRVMKEEFRQATQGKPYESPLPREWRLKSGASGERP